MRYSWARLIHLKRLLEILVQLCLVLLLPGCLWGNGEGYGNKPIGNSTVTLANGTYYEIVPGFQCAYKRAIEIQDNQISLRDGCTNTSQLISSDLLETDLYQNYIGYEEGIFEKRTTPPDSGNSTESYAEAFCTQALPSVDSYVEVIVKKSGLASNPSAELTAWNGQLLKETHSVQRTDGVEERIYESQDFSLRISQLPLAVQPSKYRGEVVFTEGGILVTRELNCRMLKP